MTNNDYIAEYVKERHPHILGFAFFMWKIVWFSRYIASKLTSVFRSAEEPEEGDSEDEPDADI